MSKYTKDHPAFQRAEDFIQEQVLKCRESSIAIAMHRVIRMDPLTTEANMVQRVSEYVDMMENRMAKRLRRYYGLNGKYVAH